MNASPSTGRAVKATTDMRNAALAALVVSAQDWQADMIREGRTSPMWRTLMNVRQAVGMGVSGRDIVKAWQDGGITLSACSLPVVGPMAIVATWADVWPKAMALVQREWSKQAKSGKRPEWSVPDVSAPWTVVTYAQKTVKLADIASKSEAITVTPAARAKALASLIIALRVAKPAGGKGATGGKSGKDKGAQKADTQKVTPSQRMIRITEALTEMLARGEWSPTSEECAAAQAAMVAYLTGRNEAIKAGAAKPGAKATA